MAKYNFGCHKSPYDSRDILITPFLFDVELPTKIDYTNNMSPIKSQGQEGACTGFAGTAVKEWMEILDYDLTPKTYIDLSERFLYENAKKISGHQEGSTIRAIVQVLTKLGICPEVDWPYVSNNAGNPSSLAYKKALKYKIQDLKYARIINIDDLKKALVKTGPILAGLLVYKNWMKDNNGHIPKKSWWDFNPLGGHAICLVGYNDATKEFKFKNSWGSWGDNGYGYLNYETLKQSIMDAYALLDISDEDNIVTLADLTCVSSRHMWV